MLRCPRCDGRADRLHQIPREALREGAVVGGSTAAAHAGEVCTNCLQEIREG